MQTKDFLIIGGSVIGISALAYFIYHRENKKVVAVVPAPNTTATTTPSIITAVSCTPAFAALLYDAIDNLENNGQGTNGGAMVAYYNKILNDNGYSIVLNPDYNKPASSSNGPIAAGTANTAVEVNTFLYAITDSKGNIVPYPSAYFNSLPH